MKLSGDVPQEHRDIAEQLDLFERNIDADKSLPKERKAQIYTCLAHDWYHLDADEEGGRLLIKAEKVSPGYFKETVIKHTLEDESFDQVIKNITLELIHMLIENVNDRVV